MRLGIGLGLFKAGLISAGVRIFSAFQTRVIGDGGTVEAGTCVVNGINGSALLQQASLLLIPSGYKGGKLYAEIPTNGNGDLTWTRGGTANRTNASGNIELMGVNVPRLSYMYGSCPAVLAEPQRTNLALRSEEFDNATWIKDNSSVTANTTISPDGSTNADTYTGNGILSSKFIYQTNSVTSATTYSISIFAKKNTNNFIQIVGATASFGLNAWANFDLNNGTVGSVGSSATASIVNVGNGWYRCVIVAPAVATGTFASALYTLIVSSTSARLESNTLSTSVFIYGAQLEAGAYTTTYIPTTSATATRVADSFSRNNIFTNGLITSSGGTWFVELRGNLNYTRDSIGGVWIGDNTTSGTLGNTLVIRNGGPDRLSIGKTISGTFTSLYTTTTNTTKIAIKWNGTTADIFANGTKVISATSFTPTNMENLVGNANDVPKFIQQMALFPSPLSDTDCQTLTT